MLTIKQKHLIFQRIAFILLLFAFCPVISHADSFNPYNDYEINERKRTPLHEAAKDGNLDLVRKLVDDGIDVNCYDFQGTTPLYEAVAHNHEDIVHFLISKGANTNFRNFTCTLSPLHLAAANGNTNIIKMLLSGGANIDIIDYDGNTPLLIASFWHRREAVMLLVKMGADVESSHSFCRNRALHFAIGENDVKLVDFLIKSGANINAMNKDGETPLALGAINGYRETVDLLAGYGAGFREPGRCNYPFPIGEKQEIHSCVIKGNFNRVKELIEKNPAIVNQTGKFHDTPLYWAALLGREKIMDLLISHGADIEICSWKSSPLLAAVYGRHINAVKILLSKGANPDRTVHYSGAPLHLAAKMGYKDMALLLINRGASVNIWDKNKNTPLHYAVKYNHKDVTALLIEHGAYINVKSNENKTPISYARENGNREIIELLIKAGAR